MESADVQTGGTDSGPKMSDENRNYGGDSERTERPAPSAQTTSVAAPADTARPASTPPTLNTPVIPAPPKPAMETAATRNESNPPARENDND